MYFAIPPVILYWAVESSDLMDSQIVSLYMDFRAVKIDEASRKFDLQRFNIDGLGPPGTNPVRAFRESLGLSTSDFCKQFRMPVALLYEAENRALTLSKRMQGVLRSLRVPDKVIREMGNRYHDL